MQIGPGSHDDPAVLAEIVCKCILIRRIAEIAGFHRVALEWMDMYMGKISSLPERMRLNYQSSGLVYHFQIFGLIGIPDLRMALQPLLVRSVDQKFIAVMILFPAEEYLEALPVAFFLCMFIALAELINIVFPRQIPRRSRISVKEMIRKDQPVISEPLEFRDILRSRSFAACTCFICMHVDFVFITLC